MSLTLEQLQKSYGATRAVDGVTLSLAAGESLALLGPSGCGKSTLLRLIAGLERADSGRVWFAGSDITSLPAQSRRFGVVFQDFALFPHLDVAANVAFGLVEQGVDRQERAARVAQLLQLVGLDGFQKRRVHQLSGGQQQRVALARAVAPRPRLLLLDEPLSNLDEALRDDLKGEIVALLADLGSAAVYVTHDQSEAFTVADKVAVMRQGRIVQIGDREELLERPRDAWTARFLGHENVWDGEEAGGLAALAASAGFADAAGFAGGTAPEVAVSGASSAPPAGASRGSALLLRGDLIGLAPAGPADDATVLGTDRDTDHGTNRGTELGTERGRGAAPKFTGTVVTAEREALGWRLTLTVPAWNDATVVWRGSSRELSAAGLASGHQTARAVVGARLGLVVPQTAWHQIPSVDR